MAWKECNKMDQKLKFVARLLEGEQMASLCREYNISRKTGYKVWNRYKEVGLEGLNDRSRRPYRQANQLPFQIEAQIIALKKEKPHWGAPKIRELLRRKYPTIKHLPATSTVHAILDRNGLVKKKKKRRYKAQGTDLKHVTQSNDLWCADYKGEFLMGNKQYCYPLTITDYHSRFLLNCEALESTRESLAIPSFERTFMEYGLPKVIRTDNGVPFSSPNALYGLSKLSVWWLRLGIQIERIRPGHPQENGRHERMHLTLKKEATKPAGKNTLQQQQKFEDFIYEYNFERPHQALEMKSPSELYTRSNKIYRGLPNIEYTMHDKEITVTSCGRICLHGKKINFSTVFAGQLVGIKEVQDQIWLVSFMNYDLGYFDEESRRFEPVLDPFGSKVLPMSSE